MIGGSELYKTHPRIIFIYYFGNIFVFLGWILYIIAIPLSEKTLLSFLLYSFCLYIASLVIFIKTKFYFLNPALLFCGFYLLTLCFGPFLLLPQNYNYYFNVFPVLAGGYICFISGYVINFLKLPKKKIHYSVLQFDREKFLYFLVLFSGIIWIIYIFKIKGILWSSDYETSRITSQSGNGAYLYLIRMWILTVPMLYEELKKRKQVPKVFYFIVSFALIALSMLGGRSPLLFIILNIIICKIILEKLDTFILVRYSLLCLAVAGFLGSIRGILSNSTKTILKSLGSIVLNGNYNLSYIFQKFPEHILFQKGYTYLINFKMILPGPDDDFTLWLKKQLGLSFSGGGVTPTIIGEFYINFGYIGIFVGLFILGFIAKWLYLLLKQSSNKSYIAYLIICFVTVTQGGIANVTIPIILYTLVYCFISIFSKSKS